MGTGGGLERGIGGVGLGGGLREGRRDGWSRGGKGKVPLLGRTSEGDDGLLLEGETPNGTIGLKWGRCERFFSMGV